MDSPRCNVDDDHIKMISYNDSPLRFANEDYRKLIGKFTRLKDSYFEENNIDPLFG